MDAESGTDALRPAPSRRERNKQETLERIKAAAEAVFVEKGFDDASIREIAARAEVGVGTVFNYAADKRDLLFLVVNEKLEATNRKAFRDVPETLPVVEQILIVFPLLLPVLCRKCRNWPIYVARIDIVRRGSTRPTFS